jgi:membrane-bound lytic murein transglycosylase B
VPYTPEQLADRQDVLDAVVSYALALDSHDWDRLRQILLPEAVAEYGMALGAREGRDAIVATCTAALTPLSGSQHLMGNHLVTLDGDRAEAVCYFQATHVKAGCPGGDNYIIAGRYDDRLVRTPAGWRIAHKTLTVVWTDGNAAVVGG